MKAIILAAGRGSRMEQGTSEIPKCMMKLWGKPLIEMCVDTLEQAGFRRDAIGIVTGYKREKLQVPGVRYFHNADWESTNMFMSLTMAGEWLEKEACIVCYSDIVFHKDAVKRLMDCDYELAVTYYTDFLKLWKQRFERPLEDMETFRINNQNIILEIGNKPNTEEEVQGQYMGLLRIEPAAWEKILEAIRLPMKKNVEKLDMTTLLNHMINCGHTVHGIACGERWLECDNQDDIVLYEKEYKGKAEAEQWKL